MPRLVNDVFLEIWFLEILLKKYFVECSYSRKNISFIISKIVIKLGFSTDRDIFKLLYFLKQRADKMTSEFSAKT